MNETVLTLALLGVSAYFCVLILRGIAGWMRFRRVRRTAIATWPGPRPTHARALLLLGYVAATLAIVNGSLHHPFHKVYSQASIALYFMGIFPLMARIPVGFYREGIWAEGAFLPYSRIRRLAFREGPDLVLLLLPWDRAGAFRLTVPPGEYGAVRRILGDKIRSRDLRLEGEILGL